MPNDFVKCKYYDRLLDMRSSSYPSLFFVDLRSAVPWSLVQLQLNGSSVAGCDIIFDFIKIFSQLVSCVTLQSANEILCISRHVVVTYIRTHVRTYVCTSVGFMALLEKVEAELV